MLTYIFSFIMLIISLLISYLYNSFFNGLYWILIIPILLMIFIMYNLEKYLVGKKVINDNLYNIIVFQMPAILLMLIALILWLFTDNIIIIKMFYLACKLIYIPILLLRFIIEIISQRNKALIISSGFIIGIIIGLSFII